MGRELTFADARIIALVSEFFIPLAGDDWVQTRRQDADGEFFRRLVDQSPLRGKGGSRQGLYVFTADGRLLQFRNHTNPDVVRGFLHESLDAWRRIPPPQRARGAMLVGERKKADDRFVASLPADALVVKVHTRILDRKGDFFCQGTCKMAGGQRTAHDHLWIRAEEWQALIPRDAQPGQEVAVPAKLTHRLARFHLTDNTRGEPPIWQRREVRKAELKLVVEAIEKGEVRLKLTGSFVLSTDPFLRDAARGLDASVLGDIRYDAASRKITKWHMVVLGEHWGESEFTRGSRPGRTPLGFAFELTDPTRVADRLPPQALREGGNYYNADR